MSMDIDTFTNETRENLPIGGSAFLLPEEENQFWEMIEQHGKVSAFSPRQIGFGN